MTKIRAMVSIAIQVNGKAVTVDVETRTLLVDVLRDQLGLTGTHIGCDTSQCGCCTVRLNGQVIKSCTALAVQADGGEIVTIEGLTDGGELHPVQKAFSECHGLQCGFCTPGMIMATIDLLEHSAVPDDEEIKAGLAGNLCRCTGYVNIEQSVRTAAKTLRASRVDETNRQGDCK